MEAEGCGACELHPSTLFYYAPKVSYTPKSCEIKALKLSACCSSQNLTAWECFLSNVLHFRGLLRGYIIQGRQSALPHVSRSPGILWGFPIGTCLG